MTDHKAATEHAKQFADSTQSGEHANLCRAYLEQAQRIKGSQEVIVRVVARLEDMQANGHVWLTIVAVLALIDIIRKGE